MTNTRPPTFNDIVTAREFISKFLPKTPLIHNEKLSKQLGCDYFLKLENLQPVGAFKVRGGVNLVGTASDEERRQGLVSASTGNHGQSIAYAGRLFNARVIIYAPAENVNQSKMQAMRDLGAEVRLHGRDFDEARVECELAAQKEGLRYVHSADEPKLIAGVGTIGLEIFEDLPDVDVIIVAAGGGSCASGNSIVAKHLNPDVRVIAVQSEAAPAMWHAWRNQRLDPYPTMKTVHEGLATRVPFELTSKILWELLDSFQLVSDEEIDRAIYILAREAKQIVEGAGAASLAAALKLSEESHDPTSSDSTSIKKIDLRGKKVVGIVSGGNLPLDRFAHVISRYSFQ
jgi:threonine dehydratase